LPVRLISTTSAPTQDWLKNCVSALQASDEPPPNTRELIHATETQLLLSHLANSCLANTGLPPEDVHDQTLFEKEGCLVMILSIQEIGASAFALKTTMEQRKEVLSGVTRIRRMKDPGEEEGEEDENDGADERLPAYSRSMLSMEVTDGFTIMKAMEYRRIPGLVLGETMLGAKVRVVEGGICTSP
jgi:RecQ-mediated genome instability protein 1